MTRSLGGLGRRLTLEGSRRHLVVDGLTLIGAIAAAYYWILLTTTPLGNPADASFYWHANPSDLYPHPELGNANGFNYSPAFLFVVGPFQHVPFEVFAALWRALILGALVWLAGPFTLPVLLTVPVASEVNAGNIQILLAAAIVLGFRHPWTWALVLLTKVTPGVGLLWFVLRREWRSLAIALASTLGIAALSFVLLPRAWFDWFRFLTSGLSPADVNYPFTFWQRLPVALAIIAIGAWRGWRWTVVVGSTIALPVFYIISPSMLVGVLPYVREWIGSAATRFAEAGMIGVSAQDLDSDSPAPERGASDN
jgi:hypothetical protein